MSLETGVKEKEIEQENKKKKSVSQKPFSELENKLRNVVENSISYNRKYVFPALYDVIKANLLFSGDIRAAFNSVGKKHKTAIVYPLIAGIFDSYSANLYDSLTLPRVTARNSEDIPKSGEAQDFCDWAYDASDSTSVQKLIRNEASLIGTSYGLGAWDKRTEETKYFVKGDTKSLKKNINKPFAEYVSFFELFLDPSTTRFYDARWYARRKILSLKEIEKRYGGKNGLIDFTQKTLDEINDNTDSVISKYDFTKIYEIKNYEHLYENALEGFNPLSFLQDNVLLSITQDNSFCELIEYYEGDKLVIMINGRVYYDGYSPFPNGNPFGIMVYDEIPGTYRGTGIGQKLMPYQSQATAYFSQIRDAVGQHMDPMYYVLAGSIKGNNGRTPEVISRIPGKVLEITDPTIPNGGINPINFIDYNIVNIAVSQLNDTIQKAQETIGTNSYVQGGQGKVERSFGAVNTKIAVTATRLKPINASIAKFNEQMFNIWLSLAPEYMDEEISVRVLGKTGYIYKTIKPEDLINKFDITVDIDAIRDITKAERTRTVIEMLNTIAPFNINPISQTPTIAPEDVINFIAGELDFEGFNPMTVEEQIEYVSKHLDIASKVQASQPQQPQQQGQPGMPMDPSLIAPQEDPTIINGLNIEEQMGKIPNQNQEEIDFNSL